MKERIQKIISARGLTSRRRAEEWILEGRVSCNGVVCHLGDTADPDIDTIFVDGEAIPATEAYVYIMLNKPRGYVTTLSDEKGRKNAAQLVADCGKRVYPVGRLDMDSDGLLIFTNDGDFANALMHPSHQIDKKYNVLVDGFSPANLSLLRRPIVLDGHKISTPEVVLVSDVDSRTACLQVTIHEGRNRQIRRMCAAAGMKVRRLTRIAEGELCLGDLQAGKWRYLTADEVKILRK